MSTSPRLATLVADHLHRDCLTFDEASTCAEALEVIRLAGDHRRVSYYYTLDDQGRLKGVVPVRRFLTAALDEPLSRLAIGPLVTVRTDMTLAEAAGVFRNHQYLALPAVRPDGSVAGILELKAVAGEEVDHTDKAVVAEVFQTIGVRLEALATGSLSALWRTRFPWLLPTVASGVACALLSSLFAATLAQTILLSFFIALVLALGESISIQSMTFSFQELHKPAREQRPRLQQFGREVILAFALGLPIAVAVGALAFVLEPRFDVSLVVASAIAWSILNACLVGLVVPWILQGLRVEPKVAGGPVVLALTDVSTLLVYLGLATVILGR